MKAASIALFLLFSLNAKTDTQVFLLSGTASNMYDYCSSVHQMHSGQALPKDAQGIEYCIGFIAGVVDTHTVFTTNTGERGPYCWPQQATTLQAAKIFVHYADVHPEELHKAAILVLSDALTDAFPCGQ